VALVDSGDWLADTRASYDTVADSYSELTRAGLAGEPYLRAALALFAGLVREAGRGPVADVGCGLDTSRLTCASRAWMPLASTCRR
jgi:hypothetical protein